MKSLKTRQSKSGQTVSEESVYKALLLVLLINLRFVLVADAQSSLNVTDYGAVGDAVQLNVNTTAGSPLVTTVNQLSSADIGKSIEVFGVGMQTIGINSYGVNSTNNLDLIAVITNVLNGTNIYISTVPQATILNAFATYGTDNTPAITNAIAAAGTNAIIHFPNGTFLCMPTVQTPGVAYSLAAICLHRGGLHFLGSGSTILLSRGAFHPEDFTAWGWGSNSPARGYLFEVVAPIANDLPIIVDNLTLDGGIQQGNTSVHGNYVNNIDGQGWDVGHCAWVCTDNGNNTGTATHQVFTNVTVQHWRGEMFKSIDQNNNGNISIHNSSFIDGNATALNIYGSWDVTSNQFVNLFQTAEYFQSYYTNTSYFQNNLVTNITGNGWACNGALASSPPFIIRSNTFYFMGYGNNGIQTAPGANISVLNNQIYCADYMTAFSIGVAGSQGTFINSNILISGNSIYASNKLTAVVSGGPGNTGFGGSGIYAVNGLTISSNIVTIFNTGSGEVVNIISQQGGSTNVRFYDNTINSVLGKYNIGSGQPMALIETNNVYSADQLFGNTGTTNLISYGGGPVYPTMYVQTAANFVLDDSTPSQIPAGAYLRFDNSVNTQGSYFYIYPSTSLASSITVTNGQVITFNWSGKAWTTNAQTSLQNSTTSTNIAPPPPPTNFRVLN